jgi:hypothetical protein
MYEASPYEQPALIEFDGGVWNMITLKTPTVATLNQSVELSDA